MNYNTGTLGQPIVLLVSLWGAVNTTLKFFEIINDCRDLVFELIDKCGYCAETTLGPLKLYITNLVPNKTQVKSLLEAVYFDDSLIPQAAVNYYAGVLASENAKYALLRSARQLIPPDLEQFSRHYAELKQPTLIIWRREDEIVPLDIGRRLHQAMPNSTLLILEAVGHAPQEENPALILPRLRSFPGS